MDAGPWIDPCYNIHWSGKEYWPKTVKNWTRKITAAIFGPLMKKSPGRIQGLEKYFFADQRWYHVGKKAGKEK